MRMIDADEAIINFGFEWDDICPTRDEVVSFLRKQKTINAVPVVRGEWIENPTKDSVLCSYCHADWNLFDNDTYRFCYCPNCGCKMEDKP